MLSDAVGYAVAALMPQWRPRGPGMRGTVSTMVVAPTGFEHGVSENRLQHLDTSMLPKRFASALLTTIDSGRRVGYRPRAAMRRIEPIIPALAALPLSGMRVAVSDRHGKAADKTGLRGRGLLDRGRGRLNHDTPDPRGRGPAGSP